MTVAMEMEMVMVTEEERAHSQQELRPFSQWRVVLSLFCQHLHNILSPSKSNPLADLHFKGSKHPLAHVRCKSMQDQATDERLKTINFLSYTALKKPSLSISEKIIYSKRGYLL